MRTIRVTGKGNLKLRPDTTRLTITLSGTYPEYADAVENCAKDTQSLRNTLKNFTFSESDLKTLSFHVDSKYEYRDDGYGNSERVFVGYEYQHEMKLEFKSDNQRLGKTLYALTRSNVNPQFKIGYTVADAEAAKNQLLEDAVADARQKASVLTQAANVNLKEIQSIDYSWGEIDLDVSYTRKPLLCGALPDFDLNIEPDDIEVSDTVTVIWEIA